MKHIVPAATQQFLTRYGGKNPFARPHWRLLVAGDRLVKESGVYRDWAEGLSPRRGMDSGEVVSRVELWHAGGVVLLQSD